MITLKTLPEAPLQDIFDQVVTHLLTQNEKCADGRQCYYRYDNLKCAAGCLIADDEYQKNFERRRWGNIEEICNLNLSEEKTALIEALQNVHDGSEAIDWFGDLMDVAKEFQLNYDILYRINTI